VPGITREVTEWKVNIEFVR